MGKIEKEKYANAKLNKFFIVWTVMYFIFCIGGAKYDNRIMGAIFYVGAYLYHPFRGIVLFVNFIAGYREKNREKNFKYIFLEMWQVSVCIYTECVLHLIIFKDFIFSFFPLKCLLSDFIISLLLQHRHSEVLKITDF